MIRLNKLVTDARAKLDEAVRTKNNIKVLGLDINKFAYNSVMWIIVAGLAVLLTIGFLVFKRNLTVTRNTKKDLEDLKTEFEAYRKQSREAREKMSMEHFNELKKLRVHVSSVASSTSEVLTKEVAKEESSELRAQSSERRAESTELGAESEAQRTEAGEQGDETPEGGSSELRADSEESKSKSDSKKPRKRRTQSPGQGSIEL